MRFDGSNYIDLSSHKKYDGDNFIDCDTIKRYKGSYWIEILKPYTFSSDASNGLNDYVVKDSRITKISNNRVEVYGEKANINGRVYLSCPELTFYSYLETVRLRVKCKGVDNIKESGVYLMIGSADMKTKKIYKSATYNISNTKESVIDCLVGSGDAYSNVLFPFVALTIPSTINKATIQIEIQNMDIGWHRYYPVF